jgi:GAF domain-containing protein
MGLGMTEVDRSAERRVELITRAALNLARAAPDDIDASIEQTVGEIATFAGANRAHVFLFDPNGIELSCTHEWCDDDAQSVRHDMQYLPADLFPWLLRRLRSSGTVAISTLGQLTAAANGERQILEGLGVHSAVAVPLVHGTLVGFVTFEAMAGEVAWPDEVLGLLQTVAELVTSAINRKDAWEGQEKLIGELRLALREVNTLSGLLPICASCKSVRDDQGYWHRVESYLHTHSDLEFTHGLCPRCARELEESISG